MSGKRNQASTQERWYLQSDLRASRGRQGPQRVIVAGSGTTLCLRVFCRAGATLCALRFIRLMAHGEARAGAATLRLTHDRVNLMAQSETFSGLRGKVILFSCCELGLDLASLWALKEASRAAGLVAYRVPVCDGYTRLAEMMLYERLIRTPWTP